MRIRNSAGEVFNRKPAAYTGHFGSAMKSKRCASLRLAACALLVATLFGNCDVIRGEEVEIENEDLLVQSKDGTLRGTHMQTKKGRLVDAFVGVPFAEPPVGELRFKVKN